MATLRKRRWLSYSVRGLLVVVTLTALGFGSWRNWVRPYQRQALAAAKLRELGAEVETVNGGPDWARRWFGSERFQEVVSVEFPPYQASREELFRIAHRYIQQSQSNPADSSVAGISEGSEGPIGPVRIEFHPELTTIITSGKTAIPFRILDRAINDEDLICLADLPRLETLRVPFSNVGDTTVARLKCQRSLMVVDLGFSRLTDEGLAHFARFEALRVLSLYRCSITDDGMQAIGKCSSLEILDVSDTFITDGGIKPLAALERLFSIDLSGTKVTARSLENLKGLKLMELDVSNTRINHEETLDYPAASAAIESDLGAGLQQIQNQGRRRGNGQRRGGGDQYGGTGPAPPKPPF